MSNIYDINDKYIELKAKYENLETQFMLLEREKELLQTRLQEKIDYIDGICAELNRLSLPKTFSHQTVSSDFQVNEQKPLENYTGVSRNLKEIVHGKRINVTSTK